MFEVSGLRPRLAWQGSLLDAGEPGIDVDFGGLVRHQLDPCCWLDVAPRWLAGSDEVFAELLRTADWSAREVLMWGSVVAEPRLTARWAPGSLPPVLEALRAALAGHYGVGFDSVGVNLYRDGSDSVAWHGDRIGRLRDPLVATVTLGARRRFLLRPRAGGTTRVFRPGPGDLLVMGGAVQHDWLHAVPKCASAGPRMAITVRHRSPPASLASPAGPTVTG